MSGVISISVSEGSASDRVGLSAMVSTTELGKKPGAQVRPGCISTLPISVNGQSNASLPTPAG